MILNLSILEAEQETNIVLTNEFIADQMLPPSGFQYAFPAA
jgi:hypothetical protein